MPDNTQTTPEDIVGHKTFQNGDGIHRHEPLTRSEADMIMAEIRAADAKRATDMPTEKDAINAMFEAWQRLKEFGWRDAEYCPKDGLWFEVIESGSTGVFRAHYIGDWPGGTFWIEDGGDLWPSRPVLYKLFPEDEEKRKAAMTETLRRYREEIDDAG